MTTVYFDWSMRNGVYALVGDATGIINPPPATLRQLIDEHLEPGDTLIGEATFESFNLAERNALIDLTRNRNIRFLTTPTRATSRSRHRLGLDDKNDANDAAAIRAIAESRGGDYSHLHPVHVPDPDMVELRERANHRLMLLRNSVTLTPKPRRTDRYNATSAKAIYAQELIEQLPAFADQPLVRQLALGDSGNYHPTAVAAVGVIAEVTDDIRVFDRLAGLHSHGYPSMIRAELHHWVWAGGNSRPKLVRDPVLDDDGNQIVEKTPGGKPKPVFVTRSPAERIDGLTWTDFRRELRWLFRQLRPIVAP